MTERREGEQGRGPGEVGDEGPVDAPEADESPHPGDVPDGGLVDLRG
ncbi:hypothetical protein HRW12_14120 [Streptomyces lunaelactis]|nr:hypothetical protein [Streptomyces lunaelactis]NUK02158.1 hypothetical protein [Streptomyces lunaelactis]NUK15991.1 hypothetical protein [Streptomyces lunaelactis]NUK34871.1 hypothetical protein [Streptomyces lunaelactis]NUK43056.1 hypothetical protein [Streptomyces lunaelactis]NUK63610.1 hypothetical protein [Streptomyces lunaelactis]